LALVLFSLQANAQKVYKGIELDEHLVQAQRQGFDINSFIERIKNDTTYYKAFKNLHLTNHTTYTDIKIFEKRPKVKASFHSITEQKRSEKCRRMNVKSKKISGDYKKQNGQNRYLTADLYEKLFFTRGKVCNENNIVNHKIEQTDDGKINKLKKLIFQPGQAISGVPGIGNKLGIFDKGQMKKYKFSLKHKELNDTFCYVFRAVPKAKFENKVVINELETWFRLPDYTIMARSYSLSYKTLAYAFDVQMDVQLKESKNLLVPYNILYKGDWKLLGKPRERANFTSLITDFH